MRHILPTNRKILSRRELALVNHDLTDRGGALVLTNGCFDLVHIGHIRYLAQARTLGDALAVGLNTDASVRKLKGPGRPVTPEAERAEILAAIEYVDFVTLFPENTAEALVRQIQPAVYVKGGDYASQPDDPGFPPEGHVVLAYGGRVETIDYVQGRSTSALLHHIQTSKVPD